MSHADLLADYLDLEPFAQEVGRHPRTILRWMAQPGGLPFTRIGRRVLVHVPTAKAWLLSGGHRRQPNRRTGQRR
jgi:hypothetical protein